MIAKTTNGVTIRVRKKYLESHSDPQRHKFIFAYHVTVTNERSSRIQLLQRLWEITPLTGSTKVVEGDGVIGQQPIIEPGSQYQYNSWCPLPTRFGSMRGHYTMRDLELQEDFEAEIPEFILEFPPALN